MNLLAVTICMTTWAPNSDVGFSRARSSEAALLSWKRHLRYAGKLRLHVADDGSQIEGYPQRLLELWDGSSGTQQERHGVGASLNAGFRAAFKRSPLVAYFVDDWALAVALDLTPWARLLMEDSSIGMVRLGPPHPDLTGTIEHLGELGWAMRLDRHHFCFAHRPALYHQRMIDAYGWFAEDVNAFDCEWDYHRRVQDMEGPDVVLALPHPWKHVGEAEVGDVVPQAIYA